MQCSKCGKTDKVTIGQKTYCASCGTAMDSAAQPAPALVQQATAPATLSQPIAVSPVGPTSPIAPAPTSPPVATESPVRPPVPNTYTQSPTTSATPQGRVMDITRPNPAPATAGPMAPTPQPQTPIQPAVNQPRERLVSDIKPVSVGGKDSPNPAAPAIPANPAVAKSIPAQHFHGRLQTAIANVLHRKPNPAPAPVAPQSQSLPQSPQKNPVNSTTLSPQAPIKPNSPILVMPQVKPDTPIPARPPIPASTPNNEAATNPPVKPMSDIIIAPTPPAPAAAPAQTVDIIAPPTQPAHVVSAAQPPAPSSLESVTPAINMGASAPKVPASIPGSVSPHVSAERIARAAATDKSQMIKKFVTRSNGPTAALPAAPPEQLLEAPANGPELPHVVASQIKSMQRLVPPAKPDHSDQPSSGPKPTSIMAATLAVAIIGGFIWLNNYPNLAILSAAQKAGIEARMPTYVPSTYHLSKQITYGPGQVTLQFSTPGATEPLTISQKRTAWNSAALLEYYVQPKSDNYLSLQTQGLTIYFYNNHDAAWINHGLQYVIEGSSRLSRDQILKIAESL